MIPLLLLACTTPQLPSNPLGAIERTPDAASFVGTVETRREAGGYTYYEVDETWVVSVGRPHGVGEAVEVRPIGRARDFHSARTGHTYEELLFAVVKSRP